MALDLALDADALAQLGPDAPRQVAELRAAAGELRRQTLALAVELGEEDRVIRFARAVLEAFGRECTELERLAVTKRPGDEACATPGEVFPAPMGQWHAAVRHDTRRAGVETLHAGPAWRISGTYLEACNCEAICPCRRVGGRAERRPTYGVCEGALSWAIEHGHVGDVDLGGLAVVLACRHDDDEPGSPWDFVIYLDDRADDRQRPALQALFTGGLGGPPLIQFPWAFNASRRLAARAVRIGAGHHARRPWFRAGDYVSVRVGDPVRDQPPVSSLIPGHHRAGIEHHADRLRVADGPLAFECSGRCAYQSTFDYASPHAG